MGNRRKLPLYASVLDNLKRLFGEAPEPDRRSVQDIYAIVGRNHYTDEQNKMWLRDRMTDIKHYGLAKPVRSPLDNKTVEYIQLTAKGKRALRELSLQTAAPLPSQDSPPAPVVPAERSRPEPTLNTVAEEIKRLRVLNPNLQIELSITVREEAALAAR